jgi:type II secretory pathway pseudopilin PulG
MRQLRNNSRHRAVTLVELLVVMALLVVLGTLGVQASQGWILSRRVHGQAVILEQTLQSARALAVRRGAPVRVVFSLPPTPEDAKDGTRDHPPMPALATLVFEIPNDPAQRTYMSAPTASTEGGSPRTSRRTEWIPMAGGAIPEAFVGRWIHDPRAPGWRRLDDTVALDGEVLDRFRSSGESFANENFRMPTTVWGPPTRGDRSPRSRWEAPHPVDYDKIPYPPILEPWVGPLGDEETMPQQGPADKSIKARSVYGSQPVRHFPKAAREAVVPLRLPAIEFAADGSLACTWTGELRLNFRPAAASDPVYSLVIDASTGRVALDPPAQGNAPSPP